MDYEPSRFDEPSLDEQLEAMFGVDGPHSADKTRAAARAVDHLMRYLCYAAERESGTPYPSTVYHVLGSLNSAVYRLDTVLSRAGARMRNLTERPDAYSTGTEEPVPDASTRATEEGRRVAQHLALGRQRFADGRTYLEHACRYASRIGLRDGSHDQ